MMSPTYCPTCGTATGNYITIEMSSSDQNIALDEPRSGYLDYWPLTDERETPSPRALASQYRGRRWFEHSRKRNGRDRKVETRVSA